MKRNVIFLIFLFTLTGCIEDYNTKTRGIDSILVVEGFITNGTTQINLSKSVGLDDNIHNYFWSGDSTLFVDNALVYVESQDGSKSETVRSSRGGKYLIETGELKADAKYRVVIQLAGEEYHSSFIAPAISPPVELTYTYDDINRYINVCVTTSGDDQQHGYYLWSYKEDWEVYSYINWDLCWKSDSSRLLILGTTEKLSVNTIHEKRIHFIWIWDDRLSSFYRIKLKQNVMHKECYDYLENLQKNTEQIGWIFGRIPSELMGNIRCVSNPKIPVIGYVDVSTTTSTELYLTSKYYDSSNRYWSVNTCMQADPPYNWCTDCTAQGGSKRKPKDWPTDHQ